VVRDFDVKGKSPHMVIPAAGGKRVFVSNADSDSLAAVDLATGETKAITAGSHPQGGVLSRDGRLLYLTCTNGNQIAIVDTESLRVTGTIPTGKGPARIALTPDGKTLVYNLQYEPGVGFADVASRKQIAQVALSGRPLSLTMTRDGRRAFAGIQDQDKVALISVGERKIERTIELPKGSGPDPAIPLE
jgi:YVTN family beta-propeller protein